MKIIVEVYGGLVSNVYHDSDEPIELSVLDYDNINCPGVDDETLQYCEKLEAEVKNMKAVW